MAVADSAETLIPWSERLGRSWPPPWRVVFAGSPELATPTLAYLLDEPRVELVGVLTQPDRPAGRGQRLRPPPVKERARAAGVSVLQPERLREARAELEAWAPDLLVVLAYGKLLPRWLLRLPRIAPWNLHASLLPRHRGAAPIQAAILAGDPTTGITLMGMEPELDAGPILIQCAVPIGPRTTGGELAERLARLAPEVLAAGFDALARGDLEVRPQDPTQATYAPRWTKDDARIDWRRPAIAVDRLVRAADPIPGAWTLRAGERIRVCRGEPHSMPPSESPGVVVAAGPSGIDVACGEGVYRITELQPAGRRAMSAAAFLAGRSVVPGERWGTA